MRRKWLLALVAAAGFLVLVAMLTLRFADAPGSAPPQPTGTSRPPPAPGYGPEEPTSQEEGSEIPVVMEGAPPIFERPAGIVEPPAPYSAPPSGAEVEFSAVRPKAPLGEIDRILKGLDLGNIAFNVPRRMKAQDAAVIELYLGLETPTEELKQRIEAAGEREGARIRVSDRMEARLSGSNFAITSVTPEVQAVTREEVSQWKWEVKPQSEGRQHLHLTVSVLLTVEGSPTPRAIRTFDRHIDIETTWVESTIAFFDENWQWLWAAILVPGAGWLWKRRRR